MDRKSITAAAPWYLLSIVFIEGFVVVALEILSIRQLIPVIGNSVVVTSFIIGVFLLFLALGYARGGRRQAEYYQVLQWNFTKATVGVGLGLSYLFVFVFFHVFARVLHLNDLFVLCLYLLCVLAPITYFLGQTLPIMSNLFKLETTVGAISGKVLFISTLGSFLGAILTSVLLLNYLGVAWTVFVISALLAFLVFQVSQDKMADWLRFVFLGVFLLVAYDLNVSFEQKNFVATNDYANYQANDELWVVNGAYSSYLGDHKQGAPYIELIKKILFDDLNLQHKNILVLGAGGFTLSAENTFANRFTYIDIDKSLYNLVKKNFLSQINGRFIAQDARTFVQNPDTKYDVVVSDAYNHPLTIVPYLLTREHFENIKNTLSKNGYAVFNIIANPTFSDVYSRHIDNTLRTVFHYCTSMPLRYVNEPTNIIYVCQRDVDKDNLVYRDNLNRADVDFFHLSRGQYE